MMFGKLLMGLLVLFSIVSLGYIVWVIAQKEEGKVKTTGQIIATITIFLAVLTFIYGSYAGSCMMGIKGKYPKGKTYKMQPMQKHRMGK